MQQISDQKSENFSDRRANDRGSATGLERRQFRDGNRSRDPNVEELANAIDQYKLTHRRRFITFEELFGVLKELGYHK